MSVTRKIIGEFNIKKQAENLGVSVWQAPSLMFIVMGIVSISSMLALYHFLRDERSVEVLVITEALTVTIIFTIGSVVIRNFEVIAQANKMKSEFVSIASHQLKAPLSKIGWAAELLILKYEKGLTKAQKKIIERIVDANDEMNRLVKDLLDVARIDKGSLFLEDDQLELNKIVEEVVKNNQDLAKNFDVRLSMAIGNDIPVIIGDKRRISIVIDNLVTNAIKYTDGGGFVEITLKIEKNNLVCCVKDNGVGIPEDQQDNIFDKFFRSENAAKLRVSGTGLGLYIAKNTIDQSGGHMWFRSIEHIGSLFCFSLPIKKRNKEK